MTSLNSIDGQPAPLAAYRGKVVLLVNVASRRGILRRKTETASNVDQENDFAPVGRERRRLAIDRIQSEVIHRLIRSHHRGRAEQQTKHCFHHIPLPVSRFTLFRAQWQSETDR